MKQSVEIGEEKGGLYIIKSKSKSTTSRHSFISIQVLVPRRHCVANPVYILNLVSLFLFQMRREATTL